MGGGGFKTHYLKNMQTMISKQGVFFLFFLMINFNLIFGQNKGLAKYAGKWEYYCGAEQKEKYTEFSIKDKGIDWLLQQPS